MLCAKYRVLGSKGVRILRKAFGRSTMVSRKGLSLFLITRIRAAAGGWGSRCGSATQISSATQGLSIFLLVFSQIFSFFLQDQKVTRVPLGVTSLAKKGRRVGSVLSALSYLERKCVAHKQICP